MTAHWPAHPPAAASGTFLLGGDLPVHRLGFGAMRITGPGTWGEPADPMRARAVLRRAVELGVTLIDTADSYGPEVSERLIADTLFPYPANLVIATKGGFLRSGPSQWYPNGRPEHLRAALEGSLRRLRLPRVELYQYHTVDPNVPLEESIGALALLRAEGKIRHIGVSNVTPDQLARARRVAPIVSVQNPYSLVHRADDALVDFCAREGLAYLPWNPLQTGSLAQPGGCLAQVAWRHGATPAQVALAWLLRRSPALLPIPGTSSVAHLEENIGSALVSLSQEEFEFLRG